MEFHFYVESTRIFDPQELSIQMFFKILKNVALQAGTSSQLLLGDTPILDFLRF